MHFTVCYECSELSFFLFFLFFFDYVIVLLFCVQQWAASIDGNVPSLSLSSLSLSLSLSVSVECFSRGHELKKTATV